VLGFKPSFGLIPRYGMMPVSRELDHVGLFGNSVADIALLFSVLATPDDRDPDCYGHLAEATQRDPSQPIKFALIRGPHWAEIESSAEQALLHSVESLRDAGATVTEIDLPAEFNAYLDHVDALLCAGLAANHGTDYDRFPEQLSAKIHQLIEKGRALASFTYVQARQAAVAYNIVLATILSRFDAIVAPVTLGTASEGLEDTGSPIFCALWSLCGLPAISIPAGKNNGLPLAIQLVGRRTRDRDLLRIAEWVNHTLSQQVDKAG
jgi:Asp-tRNA(Asn)/Glu-tRNA(Gln) amidotransferase A subunit family amidase